MNRTLLYYPMIAIPPGAWLKQAVLYWDEVGSIVPGQPPDDGGDWLNADMLYLEREDEYRRFFPESLTGEGWNPQIAEFEQEFRAVADSDEFRQLLERSARQIDSRIHHSKISEMLFNEFLVPRGLAKQGPESNSWYLFETRTAMLYMALLAKYLADRDDHLTIVGTNNRAYERFSFNPLQTEAGFLCLSASFRKLLPIPRDDVALSDIVDFKQRHRSHLLSLRGRLDELGARLSKAESRYELTEIVISEKETIERHLTDLGDLLQDRGIATVAGSLKALISVKSPTLVAAAVITVDQATELVNIPLEWGLAGVGIAGMIQIADYLVGRRNERRAAQRDEPFTYLHAAAQEGIVDENPQDDGT